MSAQLDSDGTTVIGGCAAIDGASPARQRGRCLIHVGYHRTGSSFLQTELFPRIAKVGVATDMQEAECYLADAAFGLVILTDESLSSDLICDRSRLAPELALKFPGARVLIGIRSQYTIMRGVYHLHMKAGATDDYESFVRSRCGRLFDYAHMIDAYRLAFGPGNVFVLLHEDLSRNPVESMAALLRFIGNDPALAAKIRNRRIKPSVGDPMLWVLRQRNRLITPLRDLWPRVFDNITRRGLPGARLIDSAFDGWFRLPDDRVRAMIREAYASSNARLFAVLGLNPADYDYPMPEKA